MPAALFAKTTENIYGDILYDIVNNTNLTRASAGSKLRAISYALSKELGNAYKKFDANIAKAFVDGATGRYLEFIGELLNVSRIGAQTANVSASDRLVRFYVETGTFADINGGSPILLTKGTVISSDSELSNIKYIVPFDIILSATDSETYVTVQSVSSGSFNNVGRNELVYHDFTSYTDVNNDTLKVANDGDIVTGQDIEPEANYRYRIVNKITSSEMANETAIRIAALEVPGVADLVSIPYYRGIGTFELLIKSTTPSISQGLIGAVQNAINNVKAHGIQANVRGPKETGLSLIGTLTLKRRLSTAEQNEIIRNATNNLISYINSLDIGEDFIQNEAIERVMATSAEIKNIGTANKPFDIKYLYKETRLSDNKIRQTLIGDYSPDVDERIIVENQYAGETPILLTITF